MTGFDLHQFDSYRENNRREVKKASDRLPNSIWETYSSFANCSGGVIILGVSENPDGSWKPTGITNSAFILKDFWNMVNNPQKVSKNLLTDKDVSLYRVQEQTIIVIHVPAADRSDKPVFINDNLWNGTYRRNGDGDYHCSRAEIQAMLRDAPETTADMKIVEQFDLSVLDKESLYAYRNRHRAWKAGHVFETYSDADYLRAIGAAAYSSADKTLHPTEAGLLMFGREYDIVREFPEYFLDYREMLDPSIRWTDRLQSSSGDWTGNVFDFFFRVYSKIIRDVKIPFQLDGIVRVDDTPVHEALREALANCLVNADFYQPQGVVIRKEADELVLENPGSIRTGKNQMLRGGISDPRNKAIMKMFNLIGIGERAGSGVPDIYSVWDRQGWEQPSVEERYSPDRTILMLKFDFNASAKAPKPQDNALDDALDDMGNESLEDKIIKRINFEPEITQKKLMEELNVSRATLQRAMKALSESGKIARVGGRRYGHWETQ